MEHDYGLDIENLKKEVEALKALFMEYTKSREDFDLEKEDIELKNVRPMKNMHSDTKLTGIMNRLCKITGIIMAED